RQDQDHLSAWPDRLVPDANPTRDSSLAAVRPRSLTGMRPGSTWQDQLEPCRCPLAPEEHPRPPLAFQRLRRQAPVWPDQPALAAECPVPSKPNPAAVGPLYAAYRLLAGAQSPPARLRHRSGSKRPSSRSGSDWSPLLPAPVQPKRRRPPSRL